MPFKSDKQRKWMYANEPEMAKKWEKEEAIKGKLRNLIKQEIKSVKEDNIKFSKEEMAQLHKDGKVEKGDHTIEFNESTKEYGKTLDKIAKDRQLKSISKKDRDTLIKIAKLMKKSDESVNEKVIKVSKKDDVPGNPMKMSGEEKIKKLTYSGSIDNKGSYEIKGNKLNVIGIRPRDKGFFVRHFTMKTGFRKANLYYDGVHWQGKKKFESIKESINEGFDKYYLSSLLDSRLKKKLEIAIKNLKGKVDAVGTDYIWFRMPSHNLDLLSQLITKLDRNKNVWIGDKRKNNIWDRRQKINKLEATTTVSVPGYLSPNAFSKSTQNAIDVDDEDDEKNESDLGLTYKKGKTIKVTHEKSGKELIIIDKPNVKREYEKIGYFAEGTVNELQMAPFSSQEARLHIDADIKKMSKELGRASQQVIKMMMDGVKRGRYTAMDISRGIKEGPAKRTHFGELQFIQQLWNKVRDKFRRYSKDRKLS